VVFLTGFNFFHLSAFFFNLSLPHEKIIFHFVIPDPFGFWPFRSNPHTDGRNPEGAS
jgi:hypothetical protein